VRLSLIHRAWLFLIHFERRIIIHTYHDKDSLKPKELKDLITKTLDAEKAGNVLCIPLAEKSAIADYMVIASGTSSRHVGGLARKLQEKLHQNGIKQVNMEGMAQCDWVVLDAGDVIVHLFRPEVREFYNIEKMWCHPPQNVNVEDVGKIKA